LGPAGVSAEKGPGKDKLGQGGTNNLLLAWGEVKTNQERARVRWPWRAKRT